MENAQSRTEAQKMESLILGRIAQRGQEIIAKEVGIDRAQISRWQSGRDSMISKMCRLLEAIDFSNPDGTVIIQGEETAGIAALLIELLDHIREPKK